LWFYSTLPLYIVIFKGKVNFFPANRLKNIPLRLAFCAFEVYSKEYPFSCGRYAGLKIDKTKIDEIKGFLDERESARLYEIALEASKKGPCLEIGSYCGKSAVYIGGACKENNAVLFSLDHHRGSEEQQPRQEYFDPDLLDAQTNLIDTLPFFRRTLAVFNLEDTVIPIVGRSEIVGRDWQTPLSFIFIDGSHAYESALKDYEVWSKHLMPGGYLVFHDIFPDPAKGGQAPYRVYQLAVASGRYEELPLFVSLGILKRKK
jgi:predicted O-methyltransferase YrrM